MLNTTLSSRSRDNRLMRIRTVMILMETTLMCRAICPPSVTCSTCSTLVVLARPVAYSDHRVTTTRRGDESQGLAL
jgi:hypothetical protein